MLMVICRMALDAGHAHIDVESQMYLLPLQRACIEHLPEEECASGGKLRKWAGKAVREKAVEAASHHSL